MPNCLAPNPYIKVVGSQIIVDLKDAKNGKALGQESLAKNIFLDFLAEITFNHSVDV